MLAPVANDDPLIAVVRLQRAALTERLGNSEEAMHAMQRIARDYPDSPIPAMREGDLLRDKQRFAEAIAAYDRAIARIKTPGPTDWLVYYDRGICYERSRQWTKAEADFKHALTLAPDQPFVLNYLGYSWADMGQNLAQARAMIDKAVQTPAERWCHRRQPRLGDAAPGQRRRSGDDAGARGRTGTAKMRRSTAISATPTGRPDASWRRPTSGAAR